MVFGVTEVYKNMNTNKYTTYIEYSQLVYLVGINILLIGYSLLAIGYPLLATSYRYSLVASVGLQIGKYLQRNP